MTMSPRSGAGGVQRSPQGGLAEVLDLILDKGLVIDVFAKVSLVGIEIVTIDARIVVASVDTYLRFAEATNRLDLHAKGGKGITELISDGARGAAEGTTYRAAKSKTQGVLEAGKEKWDEVRGNDRQSRRSTDPRGR
jgi:gas vesicle structural protein